MTPEFDIVIVTTDDQSGYPLVQCIESIERHSLVTRIENTWKRIEEWQIIRTVMVRVICNGEIGHSWHWEDASVVPFEEILVGENIGWDKAVNAGIALSTAPHVVLMNDDTEVQTEGWLEKLRQPMLDDPEIGMVGPVTGRPGFQEKQRGEKDVVIAAPEIRFDKYGAGTTPLSFFCVMISRPCLVDVGYMDERFAGSYGASDDDYQIRAHLKGWKIAVQPSVYVDHMGGATFGERRAAEQHVNEKKIKEKWRKRLDHDQLHHELD